MDSYDQLRERLRTDPLDHLGRKSPSLINAYELGYELALQRWAKPPLQERMDGAAVQEWAERHFGWTAEMGCRQNVVSFAILTSADEVSSFDRYFELLEAARSEIGRSIDDDRPEPWFADDPRLVEFICSPHFRDRPGLYFGGGPRLDGIWAVCNGYGWAERDLGIQDSAERRLMTGFQNWMDSRYQFAKGCPWNRTIEFLALHLNERAWQAFYDLFGMYRAGQNPDALTPTGERVMANITNAIIQKNPAADPAAVATKVSSVVKGICPT